MKKSKVHFSFLVFASSSSSVHLNCKKKKKIKLFHLNWGIKCRYSFQRVTILTRNLYVKRKINGVYAFELNRG